MSDNNDNDNYCEICDQMFMETMADTYLGSCSSCGKTICLDCSSHDDVGNLICKTCLEE